MTERREIKQRSQKVWDAAKEAYLAGETGASVARRFDVGYGNLRYRANAEGWTRKARITTATAAEGRDAVRIAGEAHLVPKGFSAPSSIEPDPLADFDPRCPYPEQATPGEALDAAVRRASRRLAQGRTREALDLLKAAEALASITGSRLPTLEAMEERDRESDEAMEAIAVAIELLAGILIEGVFADDPELPIGLEHCHLYWRQRINSPSYDADADRERAWATEREDLIALYEEDGRVRRLPAPDPAIARTAIGLIGARRLIREYGGFRKGVLGLMEAIRAGKKG